MILKVTVSLINLCYRWKSINLSKYPIGDTEYDYIRINNVFIFNLVNSLLI